MREAGQASCFFITPASKGETSAGEPAFLQTIILKTLSGVYKT
jgi:hypothetical protein